MTDAGHGVSYVLHLEDGAPESLTWVHPCSVFGDEGDRITIKPARSDGWEVAQLEPLTLTPSLLCTACKFHGFITNGKWVPA